MSNPLVYDQAAVNDPLVRSLAQNMALEVDPAVHDLVPAQVTVVCGDRTFNRTTTAHKGSPHNPLTWDDACEKFSRYTRTLLDPGQARAIMQAVGELEKAPDMGEIAALTAKR
jgi:2-methylcitrate dehydratase PrpD